MDPAKLARLQALTGQQDILSKDYKDGQRLESLAKEQKKSKAKSYIYEGTTEEESDDEIITSAANVQSTAEFDLPVRSKPRSTDASQDKIDIFTEYDNYELGQLSAADTEFCPLAAVKKYPYTFIGNTNRQRVAETFFDKNQLLDDNTWDIFYIHKNTTGCSDAIILVPTLQFQAFLTRINEQLGTELTIPKGAGGGFEVSFEHEVGTPCARYLGRSTASEEAEKMKENLPPSSYRRKGERAGVQPSDRSLEAFRQKIELLQNVQKNKKKASAEKKRTQRIADKQEWSHSVKRVQRYLGLREVRSPHVSKANTAELMHTKFKSDAQAPFVFDQDVVFISVDIESYERDHNKITEIGISTLDTRDLAHTIPGEGGENWRSLIRARHFRIKDYKHLRNHEFVDGCADRFEKEFGKSEFISLAESATVVASCFKHPFSKTEGPSTLQGDVKRNIVLVGHDTKQDVAYLRKIGYDVYNLSNLREEVDTASMWRYVTRDANPRSLGVILAELGIVGWNLHNAGNDAAYTLQAMISIAIKAIVDKQKGREELEEARLKRIAAATAEASAAALEREAEWDSNIESDGGEPLRPKAATPPIPSRSDNSLDVIEFISWDKKSRQAMRAAKRRNWDRDDAAEQGGWDSIKNTEPDRGVAVWGPVAEEYEQLNSQTTNYVPPHLRQPLLRNPDWGSNGEGSNTQTKYGNLQKNFVSAGTISNDPHEPTTNSDYNVSAVASAQNTNGRKRNGKNAVDKTKRPHVDAW